MIQSKLNIQRNINLNQFKMKIITPSFPCMNSAAQVANI